MSHRPPIRALALRALLSALPLTACSGAIVPQEIPVALTELPARPVPPANPTDRDIALLIVGQDEILGACYSQMSRIRGLLERR